MENFNRNWLIILLVAVVFGTLGFLLGRTTGHGGNHGMMKVHGDHMNELEVTVEKEGKEEMDGEGIVKIDTIIKDGKQIIIKEVKKVKN